VYLQVSEASLIDFLSTKANPCQGYTCKSTQSSHKCSSNKYIEALETKHTNKQTRLKERKNSNTKNEPLNGKNFRDFELINQATMQRENMNLNYAA